jgi:hypothetical protein
MRKGDVVLEGVAGATLEQCYRAERVIIVHALFVGSAAFWSH